ncbi:thyrotropin-releasing hormone-degrading ectoenzyme-like [Macrosteles quadrilineatus]|uniref:thyrotropin-releasing hormone-degrading ectoenzyme-like n=1 Tax=Macrosteles quadrilineatus TaxID=74068 RepID=UPI0023E25257|nr:thyrotropin-releasing hormone-degrading ectoenzyme-like [Macrosteles quadrilineatus]
MSGESTPTAYHLKIDASHLDSSDNFTGAVLVNMTLPSSVSSLQIHAENLTLNESSLVIMKQHFAYPRWDPQKISGWSVNQTYINMSFSPPAANGVYSLYVEYTGSYQSSMAGFAKVGYLFKNEQKYLAVTALDPTNARKVFPCFDEPGYKTQFSLEIIVSRPHIAISNVRPSSVHNHTETTRVFLFHDYPDMPVNQLAWAVVDHTSYGLREDNSTSTIVHTRAPYLYMNQTTWANQLSARLLQAVGNYTKIPFNQTSKQASSKIEQIVLPEFFSGTSESFGFTSFSEEMILVSPNKSSTRYIQDVALTLSRGVVRQWFGDVVSVDSWDNLWMMKGIDEYLQYVIAGSLSEMSDWELEEQVVVELTQKGLELDDPNAHTLTFHSEDETELVTTVSDSLTKYKGGALIRMLKDIFGTSFHEAISMFISASMSSSPTFPNPTSPTNFWNLLYGVATDKNIDLAEKALEDIMEEWTSTPGYPVLSITSNSSHFTISQSNSSLWWVPVTYSLQGSPNVNRVWLEPSGNFSVRKSSSNWILLNLNQTGFYRVNYTSGLWQALSAQLSSDLTQLPRLSRAQLIDDVFSFDPNMALEFTRFLRAETDYYAWKTALRHYQNLIYSMAGHSSYQLLQDYVLDLMNGVIAEVGFSSNLQDTHVDKLKRSLILEKACQFGHKSCIQKAVVNLRTWMAQTYYDPDLSSALLCAGVANSSSEVWYNVWSMYEYSIFPSVRLALLESLTCTTDTDLLYEFLNNITSTKDPVVSNKDKRTLLQTLSSKPFGAHTLLDWLVHRLQAQSNGSEETSTQAPVTTPGSNSSGVDPSGRAEDGVNSSVVTNDILPESEITTILHLILPMLTSLEDGTKLDSFLSLGNKTGLSDATLTTMRSATQKIYMQAEQVMSLNGKLTTWLEAEAQSTTSGGSTRPSSSSSQPPQTTPPPGTGGASQSTSGAFYFTSLLMITFSYQQIF